MFLVNGLSTDDLTPHGDWTEIQDVVFAQHSVRCNVSGPMTALSDIMHINMTTYYQLAPI
jgi:hypothetical protein